MSRLQFLVPLTLMLCLASPAVLLAASSRKDADAALAQAEQEMAPGTAAGYAAAIRNFMLAARDYRVLHNGKEDGRALNFVGLCCSYTGQSEKALQFYQQALPLRRAAGDKAGEASTLSNMGVVYYNTGQPEKALRFYRQALPLMTAAGDKASKATLLGNIGLAYNDTGQPEKALQFYQQALPLMTAAGDKAGEASALSNIGAAYRAIGQPGKALQFYQQALPLRRAAGDRTGEATLLSNIGLAYNVTGQPEKALQFDQQALPLMMAAGDKDSEATVLSNIGAVYNNTGQPEKALSFFQQALTLSRSTGDKVGAATVLGNIGLVYDGAGRPEKAIPFYRQALPLMTAAGDKAGEGTILCNIGAVYYNTGQPEKALSFFQQALTLSRTMGDKAGEATLLSNIGAVYYDTGQPEKALGFCQRSLPLLSAAGDQYGKVATLKLAAEALHALGRNNEARKNYEDALAAADAVIGSITQNELKRATTESFQYLYRSYIDFLLQQRNRTDDRRALEISEKARSRALRDLLAGNRSQLLSAPPAAGPGQRSIHGPVLEASSSLSGAKTPRSVSETALRDGLETIALSLPDLPIISRGAAKDFQGDEAKLSAADGPAIVYHPLKKDLAIFVVEPSGELHVTRSPMTSADLDTLIEAAREEITSPDQIDPDETKATLRKLYDTLIKPVEPWLSVPAPGHTTTLTLVPFGSLLQLPFAALIAPDGHYLIEKYAIRTSPSLTVLRYTRQRAASLENAAMRPLLFGDPVMPQGFAPLPGAMVEAKQVSAMLNSNQPTLLVQEGASEASFRKLAPASTEIHLATHGYVDELQPRLSGVILSASNGPEPEYERDGYLTVAEVFQLKLNARLVTLSACDTGLGPAGADGVFGLQSAFLSAGAASLLSSLWEVSDTATAKLMTEFYRQMETDPAHNRAQALRVAQLSLLDSRDYQQPEYWAAFQLTGEAR